MSEKDDEREPPKPIRVRKIVRSGVTRGSASYTELAPGSKQLEHSGPAASPEALGSESESGAGQSGGSAAPKAEEVVRVFDARAPRAAEQPKKASYFANRGQRRFPARNQRSHGQRGARDESRFPQEERRASGDERRSRGADRREGTPRDSRARDDSMPRPPSRPGAAGSRSGFGTRSKDDVERALLASEKPSHSQRSARDRGNRSGSPDERPSGNAAVSAQGQQAQEARAPSHPPHPHALPKRPSLVNKKKKPALTAKEAMKAKAEAAKARAEKERTEKERKRAESAPRSEAAQAAPKKPRAAPEERSTETQGSATSSEKPTFLQRILAVFRRKKS